MLLSNDRRGKRAGALWEGLQVLLPFWEGWSRAGSFILPHLIFIPMHSTVDSLPVYKLLFWAWSPTKGSRLEPYHFSLLKKDKKTHPLPLLCSLSTSTDGVKFLRNVFPKLVCLRPPSGPSQQTVRKISVLTQKIKENLHLFPRRGIRLSAP